MLRALVAQEMGRSRAVDMHAANRILCAQELVRRRLELLPAAFAAEMIGMATVHRGWLAGQGIDRHAAHGVARYRMSAVAVGVSMGMPVIVFSVQCHATIFEVCCSHCSLCTFQQLEGQANSCAAVWRLEPANYLEANLGDTFG